MLQKGEFSAQEELDAIQKEKMSMIHADDELEEKLAEANKTTSSWAFMEQYSDSEMPTLEHSDDEKESNADSIQSRVYSEDELEDTQSDKAPLDDIQKAIGAKSINVRPRLAKSVFSLKEQFAQYASSVCETLASKVTSKTNVQRTKIPIGKFKPEITEVIS